MADASGFLQYHEPSIVQILVIVSLFLLLSIAEWIAATVLRAGLIGQIAIGIIFGRPLGDILLLEWQETFIALGYFGLILIIFEGGLTARLDLLKSNLIISLIAATIGSATPIGLSYLLLYFGFSFGVVETFIVGASLSSTSLGTTMVVLRQAGSGADMSQTKAGTILLSAAVIDDVAGLVMASVISNLGRLSDGGEVNLGWLIGRPIVASVAMVVAMPVVAKFFLAPVFRHYVQRPLVKLGDASAFVLMTAVLCASLSIASYAGTSVLYGAFLAGTFLSYLPKTSDDPALRLSFAGVFNHYVQGVLHYIFEPLFFASIGFAIPFLKMWTGKSIWRGIVFSLLMVCGKLVVGLSLPLASFGKYFFKRDGRKRSKATDEWRAALLVGLAMVARGEIGLLIIQIGFNNTNYLSQEAFIIAIWAIVLNTIIGPVSVGLLMKKTGEDIVAGHWGSVDSKGMNSTERVVADEEGIVE